ncbi:MAG: hypothetical protein HDS03_00995 [Bacteroides sp.]|nr:hypothetical protein [Bacteroides sp.]
MSILDSFEDGDWAPDGKMDKWMEKRREIIRIFNQKLFSVLIIDPDNQMSLSELEGANPQLNLLKIDLADCKNGAFNKIGQHLNQHIAAGEFGYDGLLLDNIDRIDAGEDTEDLQVMVWQALKRDDSEIAGYQILPFGEAIPFDKMMIATRCRHLPDYIEGKSLLAYRVYIE